MHTVRATLHPERMVTPVPHSRLPPSDLLAYLQLVSDQPLKNTPRYESWT